MLDGIMENEHCPCAPPVVCPNCLLTREIKKMHDSGYADAKLDQITNENL